MDSHKWIVFMVNDQNVRLTYYIILQTMMSYVMITVLVIILWLLVAT